MNYVANEGRYNKMLYRRCGESGVMLPAMSLGLWHSFGENADYNNCKEMILGSFDSGITHFDLANNYGPTEGSAEVTFGKVLKDELKAYRDQLLISTKAGYYMWEGPYGEWGSRKHLISSVDQSLKRMGLEYVDIFYHHRPDPNTPIEETAMALSHIVKSGKALYVGISNYNSQQTKQIATLLKQNGTPCIINQFRYSMLASETQEVFPTLKEEKMGSIAFSALAQGLLTGKYSKGIPSDSRAATDKRFLNANSIDKSDVEKANKLEVIAKERGQSLSQFALAWCLREGGVTSVILGASRLGQIHENLKALDNINFTSEEIKRINEIL